MAPSDRPGANSRGRGGKFRKFTRGGGKQFSRDLRPVDADGNPISMWSADAQKKFAEGSDDDSEEDSEEESDSDDAGPSQAAANEPSRADRKQDKKARKEAAIKKKAAQNVQVGDLPPSDSDDDSDDDDMPANPNHSKAARNMTRAPEPAADVDGAAEGVKGLGVSGTPNRRERESMEAAQAKERYRKLHEQGKTDEAKADMARLKLIREQRDAEAARRQAEKEEREAQEKARKEEIDKKEAKKREAALGSAKKTKKSAK